MHKSFDVEMTDYDQIGDITTVRISDSETNATIAQAELFFDDEDGELACRLTSDVMLPVLMENAIRKCVSAELSVHQQHSPHIETLRDLFAVCTPSGQIGSI